METKQKTAAAITVGCRLNQADTALIYGRLQEAGYEILEPESDKPLDLIIINSCAVTAAASQKSRQYARSCRKKHPEAKIIATGCDSEIEKIYWMQEKACDIYIPNAEKSKILDYINGVTAKGKYTNKNIFKEDAVSIYPFRSRAFIKIQEGCESFCTYCIVPFARGPERSRDRNDVICEFRKLIEQGHHEIVLTGVNISTYKDGPCWLSDLLSELSAIDGDFRIRLSSTEPHPENKNLIGIMKDNPKICRFLHLPLQHGTNEILKLMGRKYTAEEFADFANEAISSIPGLHLGTDVICGFPGETDELFEKSCRFIENIQFANLHVFCYSPRPGTAAVLLPDKVPGNVMKYRHKTLLDIEDKLADRFLNSQIWQTLRVLIEKVRKNGDCEGWTDNYIRVQTNIENAKVNSFADVLIKNKSGKILEG
jgi:threonylcarbamoyladenosine tRNA methylthiotransferase MtaB